MSPDSKKGAIINTQVPRYTFIVKKQLVVYCSLKYLNTRCRVLTATKANTTVRFIRSTALLDNKSTHSLNARSHCSARTYNCCALLLIQPLYTRLHILNDQRRAFDRTAASISLKTHHYTADVFITSINHIGWRKFENGGDVTKNVDDTSLQHFGRRNT